MKHPPASLITRLTVFWMYMHDLFSLSLLLPLPSYLVKQLCLHCLSMWWSSVVQHPEEGVVGDILGSLESLCLHYHMIHD